MLINILFIILIYTTFSVMFGLILMCVNGLCKLKWSDSQLVVIMFIWPLILLGCFSFILKCLFKIFIMCLEKGK